MGVDVISNHILIESPKAESDELFCAAIEEMIVQSYGHRPDWLQFSAGDRFSWAGEHFREFVCAAGSVSLFLMRRAKQDNGFTRGIIIRADNGGVPRTYEIKAGVEMELKPSEITAIGS